MGYARHDPPQMMVPYPKIPDICLRNVLFGMGEMGRQ